MDMHLSIPINLYLTDHENGISYIGQYFKHLSKRARALIPGE